jgi:arylsulfatase A-like enzyme
LRELGLDRRTLVAFIADHGEEFLEHGQSWHGQSVYSELTQVPLVVWYPGVVPAGTTVASTVESIDLMPTLLELAHVRPPASIQGRSLVPILMDRASTPVATRASAAVFPAFSEKTEMTYSGPTGPKNIGRMASVAVVDGGWKLIRNANAPPDRAALELFERATDPLDQHNVAADHPDIVKRLASEIDEWRTKASEARLDSRGDAKPGLHATDLQSLRGLGYVK